MAACKLITSIVKATAAAGLAALVVASPAGAEPVYHLTLCGGPAPTPSSPCYVQSTTIAPPTGSTDGLTNEAIANFLVNNGVPAAGFSEIHHTIAGANSAGYVWGTFFMDYSAFPLFIFRDGRVLCCIHDGPWIGISINNNGVVIGRSPSGLPFISPFFDLRGPTSAIYGLGFPDLDAGSKALLASLLPDFPNGFWISAGFLAIDDADRVSGFHSIFGAFLLTPTEVTLVPEPASSLLVLGALAMLFGVRRVKV